MIIFAVAIVTIVGLFVWGYVNHKNIDSIPSLEQIVKMENEAELNSCITNFTKYDLIVAWGEPNESSSTEQVWIIDDNTKLVVNYHNNDDKPIVCDIIRTE